MELAYESRHRVGAANQTEVLKHRIPDVVKPLMGMLSPSDMPSALAAGWAFAWFGGNELLDEPYPELLLTLFGLWRTCGLTPQGRYPAWGLQAQALLARDCISTDAWGDCDEFIMNSQAVPDALSEMRLAGLVVGWYRRSPWSDPELVEQLRVYCSLGRSSTKEAVRILQRLGDAGRRAIKDLGAEHPELADLQPAPQSGQT